MKRSARIVIGSLALAVGAVPATMTTASAQVAPGETSLAEVLTSDGNKFDKNAKDFDIVTEAALAVIGAKPDTPVALLADGSTRLTAFAPTDQAFRLLAKDLTGKTIRSEKKVFSTLVEAAGVDTIETVLLYHVVAGKTLTSNKVLKADGARLKTAAGATVKVKIRQHPLTITLKDRDRDDRDARVVLKAIDVNKGNKQVAHGVDRVLRPINL
ncbi:fasciclin domain-containing protein [Nocardioides seonyuensis]|uniref:Fasciclin domain-containing protein n=1 Tax=Nocardioides seonyuensis TaxID=2518371 RepID=A0A4P7IGE2_9ACTN|nr:fasciclin domain-containing protein [Nocardioides seonyuensis]QBX54801.1 fasciclin domain-containing protein [Nocardioides seonyuensis]